MLLFDCGVELFGIFCLQTNSEKEKRNSWHVFALVFPLWPTRLEETAFLPPRVPRHLHRLRIDDRNLAFECSHQQR